MPRRYNLYISHSWTYSDAYDKLDKLLDEKLFFIYKNFFVPKNNPVHTNGSNFELQTVIKNYIIPCHVVIILAGVYSSYSNWIDKEISIAKTGFSAAKPILAIEMRESERANKVTDNADLIVTWNKEKIVSAIKELSE